MNELELVAFEIISNVGMAKSLAIEAIREARNNNFEAAESKIEEAKKFMVEGHHAHAGLITKEANGEALQFSLIIMHAEDQLMSAETIKDIAVELIEKKKKIVNIK